VAARHALVREAYHTGGLKFRVALSICVGRPSTFGGVQMRNARRHRRIRDTQDLHATLQPIGRSPQGGGVLNLSEGGMLVAGGGLSVGEQTGFELVGPSFHYAGVAEVAHLTAETTGLRFLSWQGHADRPVRSLIDQRSDWHTPESAGRPDGPVIRRVAVLVGPGRAGRHDPSSLSS
jgi:hypothetical protein